MNCENYQLRIQEFFDGELDRKMEPELFDHLSDCGDCRYFFKSLNTMRREFEGNMPEAPFELDEKVFGSIENSSRSFQLFGINRSQLIAYVAAAVFLIFSIFSWFSMNREEDNYRTNIKAAMQVIENQNRQIQMLLNTHPAITVRGKLDNKVLIRGEM